MSLGALAAQTQRVESMKSTTKLPGVYYAIARLKALGPVEKRLIRQEIKRIWTDDEYAARVGSSRLRVWYEFEEFCRQPTYIQLDTLGLWKHMVSVQPSMMIAAYVALEKSYTKRQKKQI